MRILFFGNSHVGAFKEAFDQSTRIHENKLLRPDLYHFCVQNEIDFISLPGPNWKEVAIKEGPVVTIPDKAYRHVNGVRTDVITNSYNFNQFNTKDYDCIIWCQGTNVISKYLQMFDHCRYPALLTSSLLQNLLSIVFTRSPFYRLVSANNSSQFFYCGAPVRFLESSNVIDKDFPGNTHVDDIHSRNIAFMRGCASRYLGFGILMPTVSCINSAGRFTYDKYARVPGRDLNHANALYGIEMLESLRNRLKG